jgi:predicted RNase H-like HicB family nuclease
METRTFSAVLNFEEGMFVASCPESGTASQAENVEKALANLKEATELYLEEFPVVEETKPIFTFFEVNKNVIKENIGA